MGGTRNVKFSVMLRTVSPEMPEMLPLRSAGIGGI